MQKQRSRVTPCDTLCVESGACMVPCNATIGVNNDIENTGQVSKGKQDEWDGLHDGKCMTDTVR